MEHSVPVNTHSIFPSIRLVLALKCGTALKGAWVLWCRLCIKRAVPRCTLYDFVFYPKRPDFHEYP